jgi:hypothetical protein
MMIKGEMLEILMGKYMDGQITPAENRMLQEALEADEEARELFEQLQILHERCEEAVDSEILNRGQDFEEVFDRAWKRRGPRVVRVIVPSGAFKFVAGLAAGILIGLGIHLTMSINRLNNLTPEQVYATAANRETPPRFITDVAPPQPESASGMTRNVDWYSFTDNSGNEYLIEGYRQNTVKPPVRRGI